jgi:hypothetical protein
VRGCFFVLVLGVVLLAGIAWFGSGPLAAAAIGAVLGGSGYRATTSEITATADPPPRLLLGHADQVSITGSNVDWRALHAGNLSLTLDDVDLFGRTAATIRGSISDARLDDGSGGSAPVTSIQLTGPADAAKTTIVVDPAAVRAAIIAAAARQFGVTIDDVQLVAPDRLELVTALGTLGGSLTIDGDGALAFATRFGTVPILSVDPSLPLRLTDVAVVDGALQLEGVLDVESLLRG